MIGEVYGYLTVLDDTLKNKHKQKMCLCRCICGNEKLVPAHNLKNNHTRSCGCKHYTTIKDMKQQIEELEKKLANQLVAD